jgi:hypothetical protein
MTSFRFLILAFIVFLLIGGSTAQACDCVGPRGKAALDNAKVAFSGKVLKIRYLDRRESIVGEPRIIVTFQVYRVWKGRPKSTIVLHTVLNKGSCNGYWFKEGEEYLVFARANDHDETRRFAGAKHTLGVGTCSGTSLLADAKKALEELGGGLAPR